MSAGTVIGAAALAIALVAIPGKTDPTYTADCAEDGTASRVEPDTRANREAAAEWCAELVAFQHTEEFERVLDRLWSR